MRGTDACLNLGIRFCNLKKIINEMIMALKCCSLWKTRDEGTGQF